MLLSQLPRSCDAGECLHVQDFLNVGVRNQTSYLVEQTLSWLSPKIKLLPVENKRVPSNIFISTCISFYKLDSACEGQHMTFVFLVWLTSLRMKISNFIYFPTNGICSLGLENGHCVCIPCLLYPFSDWWASRRFFNHCKEYHSNGGVQTFLWNSDFSEHHAF